MPSSKTKHMKGNPVKKEQIAEKVKEIQQRQKNWMRQRDEYLKTEPATIDKDTAANRENYVSSGTKNGNRRDSVEHTSSGADILRVHHDSSQHLASQVSDKLNVKVKHGFGAWLQSRKHGDDIESQAQDSREEYSSIPNDIYNNHFQNKNSILSFSNSSGVSTLQNSSRTYPLSPAEFDSLADNIAARVKKDLGIKHSDDGKSYDGAVKKSKTFVQDSVSEQSTCKAGGNNGISSDNNVDVGCHRCPICSSLMATAAHVPMLLVPCGHTVCKSCSSSHTSCRLCGTHVGSLTTNIMLHQIIQEFHGKGHQGTTGVSSMPATAQTAWGRENGGLPLIPPKTTAKYCDVNYSSQLQSLLDRQAALQEEYKSCKGERDHITSKVKRAEKQVKAIEKEETSLQQQMEKLQEQLEGLRQHKEEYAGEYHQLQKELKVASDQAMMVERTLKSLEEEIDKVQFLAEGQGDSYLQRHSQYR